MRSSKCLNSQNDVILTKDFNTTAGAKSLAFVFLHDMSLLKNLTSSPPLLPFQQNAKMVLDTIKAPHHLQKTIWE